ncbi:MAG: hypothetical protein HC765_15900 [Brachymonas sp.]|nr:hypothetical protein [Brachymonas sp.]
MNPDPARRVLASEWTRHLDELIAHEMRACDKYPKDIEHVHFKGKPCHMCKLLDGSTTQGVSGASVRVSVNAVGGAAVTQQVASPTIGASSAPVHGVQKSQPVNASALPPPVKRSKLRWILPLIVVLLVALFAWLAASKSSNYSSLPPAEPTSPAASVPAPPVRPEAVSNKILSKEDYPNAVAGFADQLTRFQRLSRDQNGELDALIKLSRTVSSQEEFLQGSKELFMKPSDAWDILSSKVSVAAAGANVRAMRLDALARAEYDVAGVTRQVLTNQALATETMPTSPVFTTNLAHYLLAVSPEDALAVSVAAMHLQARTGQPIRIHALEVIASAAMRMTSENEKAAESLLMAAVWVAQDLDRRCIQMNRYSSLYPEIAKRNSDQQKT